MANVTFDLQWKEGMVELLDQLDLLDPDSNESLEESCNGMDQPEKFQHFATLYIRYLQIFRKLEESYDQMVHPQKRMDIKKALEATIGRVLEVKEILVEVNPNKGVSFVNLDEVLVDLKLSPSVLEVPVPAFFIEDQAAALKEREALLQMLLAQAGLDKEKKGTGPREDTMTLESSIRVLQLNERGRQGRQRAKFMKDIRAQEEWERKMLQRGDDEREPDVMATLIQQYWRGYSSRKATELMRAEELIFIGMAPPPPHSKEVDPLLKEKEVKKRRKLIQAQHEEEYRQALVSLDKEVYDNEGPDMKEEMMDQLRDWYIKYREREGKFPDFPPPQEEPVPADAAAAAGKDAKGGKDAKKDDKGKKDDKKKDAKKGKGGEEEEEGPPKEKSKYVMQMQSSFQEWSDKWQHRDEAANFAQKHDVELVKQMVRPDVELRVRDDVNVLIAKEIENLQLAFERDAKGKKGKKGKGGKKKKGKGKKGKGGKKGKKGPKDPTADKSIEYLYRELVNQGILQPATPTKVSDYVGSFLFLGAAMDKLASAEPTHLPDPSFAQIRAAVTEYCILPLGSQVVKDNAPLNTYPKGNSRAPKNATPVLLTGSHGAGKKMLVNAIASECGANLFNLSPSNTEGKYTGKKAYEMVHTTLKVAKALPPSVVWIDGAESVFTSGKKKGGGEPPNRILKHLTACLNPKKGPALLEPSDRVLIVGTSSQPYMCEKAKDYAAFKDFFAKILLLPLPDYPARQMLWTHLLEKGGVERPNPDEVQTLSRISENHSSGSICNVVSRTLTARRVERLARKPFSINELIGPLSKEEPVYHNVDAELRDWYHKTLGIGLPPASADGGKGGDKKKGGKKKK